MGSTRRNFLAASSLAAAATTLEARPARAAPARPDGRYTPVTVPNGATLPYRLSRGVKVFHLVAEPVKHEMTPGLVLDCWGYNGRTPGPVIEAVVGDRVRIYVTNKLPAPTSVHWHGVILPSGMDGVAGISQPAIRPGQTFRYELTLKTAGTFMYHPHYDEMTQIALGMMGMLVVHDRAAPKVDRDFALMLGEWHVPIGASRPDTLSMNDFNMLTFNGKAFPGTAPLVAKAGDRVRIRLGNLGPMDHHGVHLHGHSFEVTATDGGPIPASARRGDTTVLVPVGATRDLELVANPGDWVFHCHMTHHMMNQMGHRARSMIGADTRELDRTLGALIPEYMTMGAAGMGGHGEHGMPVPKNSVPMKGAPGPFGYVDMGGMFTILKVREQLDGYDGDPGWYAGKPEEQAREATAGELAADGIVPALG